MGRNRSPAVGIASLFEVPDIDTAVRDLSAKGGRFRSEPIQGPGGRQILCEDPSGNPIELFEAKR